MSRTNEDARALLRAAQDIHAERYGSQTFTLGTYVPLEAAAQRIGISTDGFRYYDAVKELEYEAGVEWDTSAQYAGGNTHYVITKRGLDMLRESGWSPNAP